MVVYSGAGVYFTRGVWRLHCATLVSLDTLLPDLRRNPYLHVLDQGRRSLIDNSYDRERLRQRLSVRTCPQVLGSASEHQNFSRFGIVILVVISNIFIILPWTIQWIYVKLIWRFPRFNRYRRLEWMATVHSNFNNLHMSNWGMAHGKTAMVIPMPDPDEKLAVLDVKESDYPHWKVPRRENSEKRFVEFESRSSTPAIKGNIGRWEADETWMDSDQTSDKGSAA